MRWLFLAVALIIGVGAFDAKARWRRVLSRKVSDDLQKTMRGVNLTERYERLQMLGNNSHIHFLAAFSRAAFDPSQWRAKKNITRLQPLGDSILDVNNDTGVTDYLYDGDIQLTDEQLNSMIAEKEARTVGEGSRKKRQIATNYVKWPNNVVYYQIDSSINARKQASIAYALNYLQSRTCIRFQQSATAANRVLVQSLSGCYSYVGMVGGAQTLSIGDGCEVYGIAAHEFAHALGFIHTHQRFDRNSYISVNLGNVSPGQTSNFDLFMPSNSMNVIDYEYGSMMHYGANAFSSASNLFTMVPINQTYLYTIGSTMVSFYDIKGINLRYGCSCSNNLNCRNGGEPNPANCATCNCPSGYDGALCDQRPNDGGATLAATTNWQAVIINVGDGSQTVYDIYNTKTYWITAPANNQVQVRIISMTNPQTNYGCVYNGVEIKANPDPRAVNPRVCDTTAHDILTSALNPTPIIAYNRYFTTTVTIEYRYVASTGPPAPAPATTAGPPVTAGPGVTTQPSPSCVDQSGSALCAQYAANGFCTSPYYSQGQIKQYCGATCNLCGGPSSCADSTTMCAQWAVNGFCDGVYYTQDQIMQYCAKTCRKC